MERSLLGPKPPEVVLSAGERAALARAARVHTPGQQLAQRAWVVQLATAGPTTGAVARALGLDVDTARHWRARWGRNPDVPLAERTFAAWPAAAPRPASRRGGRPSKSATSPPEPASCRRPPGGRSASGRGDVAVRRGLTDRFSSRHATRLLNRRPPAAAPRAVLAHPGRRRPAGREDRRCVRRPPRRGRARGAGGAHRGHRRADRRAGPGAGGAARPPRLGRPERREFECLRLGTLAFTSAFDVASGHAVTTAYGPTRTEADFAARVRRTAAGDPTATRWHLVTDNLDPHRSETSTAPSPRWSACPQRARG